MTPDPESQPVVATAHLFRPLGRELIALLRTLPPDAWSRPTSAGEWTVRDVAAHLLDADLRRLSSSRDGHFAPPPRGAIMEDTELVAYLNELNRTWVDASLRLSPRVITDHLELSTGQVADAMEAADPLSPATFPVAWAGHTASPMWLDIGREYTERWHHQDQIRDACDLPALRSRVWLRPVIEISLCALPHAYRVMPAPAGTRISLRISGEAGGDWYLEAGSYWLLHEGRVSAECTVTAPDLDIARLLLHRLPPAAGTRILNVEGDAALAEPLLAARAVMV